MWLGFALCMQTIVVHLVAHGIDTGMSPAAAAATLSIVATSSVFGKLMSGFVADRIGSRLLLALCLALLTVSIGPLVFASAPWAFYMCALSIGLAHGMGVPMLTVVPADMFGLRSLGTVFGMLFFMGNLGGAIGPPLSGWIFDVTRSYAVAFLVATIVGGASFALGMLLVRSARTTVAAAPAKTAGTPASSA
jgi:MFS family permease